MNKLERFAYFTLMICFLGWLFADAAYLYREKTSLEIQKLKYELSVYKEMEESGE